MIFKSFTHMISYNPIITLLLFKVVNLYVYSHSFCLWCLTYITGFLLKQKNQHYRKTVT